MYFWNKWSWKIIYTKLLILRYRLLNLEQYIIDPEREYDKICDKLDGVCIKFGPSSESYINIMDIREDSIEEEKGFLTSKISKLRIFFSLVFGDLDEDKIALLEEKLIEVYKEKGITFNDNSLYNYDENGFKKEFKNTYQMPILEDLYNIFSKDKKTLFFKRKLYPFVFGSLKFLNNYTNVELDNKLIVADIYELGEENLKYGMYILLIYFGTR